MELLNRVGSGSHHLPDKAALFLTGQMAHKILISAKGAALHCLQSGSKVTLKATVLALRARLRIKHTKEQAMEAAALPAVSRSCFTPGEQLSPGLCAPLAAHSLHD